MKPEPLEGLARYRARRQSLEDQSPSGRIRRERPLSTLADTKKGKTFPPLFMPTQQSQPSASPLSPPSASAFSERIAALRAGDEELGPIDGSNLRLLREDLSELDLRGANFRGADLSRCNLRGSQLLGACFEDATLFEADLSAAELAGANLAGANLAGANLTRTSLALSDLSKANLDRADLTEAALMEAKLCGARLQLAVLDRARLHESDLTGSDFTGAKLEHAFLDSTRVTGATFDKSVLRGASLSALIDYKRASWIGVDMREIDFTGAYLCRNVILDQNYLDEFRKQSRWTELVYQIWKATSDCGRSLGRWALCTLLVLLGFALIYNGVAIDYGDHRTVLSPLYFSVVTLTTLGYGDVLPASTAAQVVAMAQVITGYVMLGGLLSILSNKMASRAN